MTRRAVLIGNAAVVFAFAAGVYGVFGGLQRSSDAGVTWTMAGQVPPRTVDIAASAVDPNRVYAAAVGGLFVSTDAGATWAPLVEGAPVSLVELGPGGELFAFALGAGSPRRTDRAGAASGHRNRPRRTLSHAPCPGSHPLRPSVRRRSIQ